MQNISGLSITGINGPKFDGTQLCAQVDPELFFPEDHIEARKNMPKVKLICGSCQFKDPCLNYALKYPELQGIWAATTEKERRFLRRGYKPVSLA